MFDKEEDAMVQLLMSLDQAHLFDDWDKLGKKDKYKHEFLAQCKKLNDSYPGGLEAYITRARVLLQAAKNGENPLDGWRPYVPSGNKVDPMSSNFKYLEELGMKELGSVGFILVAGGLGERLGFNGIKVALPTQTVTQKSYLDLYCTQILAIEQRYAPLGLKLPLAIMVSDDTASKTIDLLTQNNYFGLEKEQVTIMKQEKVAALISVDAKIAKVGKYCIDSKPHGHGDVHSLMHSTGTAEKWKEQGIKWCVFFQDTNGLSINALAMMLGVSVSMKLEVSK